MTHHIYQTPSTRTLMTRSLPAALTILAMASALPASEEKAAPIARGKGEKMLVYVGTYTNAKSKGIYRLELDTATGSLSPASLAAETPSPSFLAIHPNRRYLYAVNEIGSFG